MKPVHLDEPRKSRIWSCKYPVRTACGRWISNESGVTTVDASVTCDHCKGIIANRGHEAAVRAEFEEKTRRETALVVAEARRKALIRRREKIKAEQDARAALGKTMEGK